MRENHYAMDDELLLITYTGDYAVVTAPYPLPGPDTPELETSVLFVGPGSIGDMAGLSLDTIASRIRWVQGHPAEGPNQIMSAHAAVVSAVQADLLDLSGAEVSVHGL